MNMILHRGQNKLSKYFFIDIYTYTCIYTNINANLKKNIIGT